ncbi:MAG: hypothetical protein HY821_25345 [Acidobacteria bacterium]|nr:hypothetical protein [Acidobacteriota bacterium]
MRLALHHDEPSSAHLAARFAEERVLSKIQAVDSKARRKGLSALDPAKGALVRLGVETDGCGRVTRNAYTQFRPIWAAARMAEWAAAADAEMAGWKSGMRSVIWVATGGLAADKLALNACGLLAKGPKQYVLDSSDPGMLEAILRTIESRTRCRRKEALGRTAVMAAAGPDDAQTPLVVDALVKLYEKHAVDVPAHFLAITPAEARLGRYCAARGIRVTELALDNDAGAAWRHSAPLTRAGVYALALAGVDPREWARGAALNEAQIHSAWSLASFLCQQAAAGRGKVTLLLSKSLQGAAGWTKLALEESLGQGMGPALRIITGEPARLADYRPAKDARADRTFVLVERKGEPAVERQKLALLKRAGYPVAVLQLDAAAPLSAYLQFIHCAVFGLAWLHDVNFAVRPAAALSAGLTEALYQNALFQGGVERTGEWLRFRDSIRRVPWRAGLCFHYDRMPCGVEAGGRDAASAYASILQQFSDAGVVNCGELIWYGDSRYSAGGGKVRKALERGAARLYRGALKMPCDVLEGPALSEATMGQGGCFTTLVLPWEMASGAGSGYLRAQFLAAQACLEKRVRLVVVLSVKDASAESATALEEFFRAAAAGL